MVLRGKGGEGQGPKRSPRLELNPAGSMFIQTPRKRTMAKKKKAKKKSK
jgi:hypothetical protein